MGKRERVSFEHPVAPQDRIQLREALWTSEPMGGCRQEATSRATFRLSPLRWKKDDPDHLVAKAPTPSPTAPIVMGLSPAYSQELQPLNQRYGSISSELAHLEARAAAEGYEQGAAKALEATVLVSPPWSQGCWSNHRKAIADKADELRTKHPHLASSDSADYDDREAQKASDGLQASLGALFEDVSTPVEIGARAKSSQSLARKLERGKARSDDYSLAHVTDTVGARVDCANLGGVGQVSHRIESQYEGKIVTKRDYFSAPQENGYRALHYVVDLGDRMAEIQVSTQKLRKADLATHDTVYKREVGVSRPSEGELSSTADRMMFLECLEHLQS